MKRTLLIAMMTTGILAGTRTTNAQPIVVVREALDNYTPLDNATSLATPDSDDNEYDLASPFPIRFFDDI
ncbi:MAG: hypothetical protein AAFN74_19310, partial [Myxococcota bacterium]